MLKKVQEGGAIDTDLDVVYWNGSEDLADKMIGKMISDTHSVPLK